LKEPTQFVGGRDHVAGGNDPGGPSRLRGTVRPDAASLRASRSLCAPA
jgi:hypothetical protein